MSTATHSDMNLKRTHAVPFTCTLEKSYNPVSCERAQVRPLIAHTHTSPSWFEPEPHLILRYNVLTEM